MGFIFRKHNSKARWVAVISIICTVVIASLLVRADRRVLIASVYEQGMVYLPFFSSVGNLVDKSGHGTTGIPVSERLAAVVYAAFNIPKKYAEITNVSKAPVIKIA